MEKIKLGVFFMTQDGWVCDGFLSGGKKPDTQLKCVIPSLLSTTTIFVSPVELGENGEILYIGTPNMQTNGFFRMADGRKSETLEKFYS